jgi:hypothetical protein
VESDVSGQVLHGLLAGPGFCIQLLLPTGDPHDDDGDVLIKALDELVHEFPTGNVLLLGRNKPTPATLAAVKREALLASSLLDAGKRSAIFHPERSLGDQVDESILRMNAIGHQQLVPVDGPGPGKRRQLLVPTRDFLLTGVFLRLDLEEVERALGPYPSLEQIYARFTDEDDAAFFAQLEVWMMDTLLGINAEWHKRGRWMTASELSHYEPTESEIARVNAISRPRLSTKIKSLGGWPTVKSRVLANAQECALAIARAQGHLHEEADKRRKPA